MLRQKPIFFYSRSCPPALPLSTSTPPPPPIPRCTHCCSQTPQTFLSPPPPIKTSQTYINHLPTATTTTSNNRTQCLNGHSNSKDVKPKLKHSPTPYYSSKTSVETSTSKNGININNNNNNNNKQSSSFSLSARNSYYNRSSLSGSVATTTTTTQLHKNQVWSVSEVSGNNGGGHSVALAAVKANSRPHTPHPLAYQVRVVFCNLKGSNL